MQRKAILFLLATLITPTLKPQDLGPEDKGVPGTVTGWLRDVACLMRYKHVTKPLNDCPKICARAGSPLVIATLDGRLYTPISTTMPETDQRHVLMPHVGKYVRVEGRLFDRSGMRTIAVEKIEEEAEPGR